MEDDTLTSIETPDQGICDSEEMRSGIFALASYKGSKNEGKRQSHSPPNSGKKSLGRSLKIWSFPPKPDEIDGDAREINWAGYASMSRMNE